MLRTETTDRKAARAEAPRARRVRTDIQGLRALAVVLVLVYHLVPDGLTGGYVGVDVFFVISGFLITGQLLGEVESTGTVRLGRFWARRAKRLLPAALLVLVLTLLAVWILAPSGFVPSFLLQLAASAAYVQNWVLAGQAVDYMADEGQVSPVQHYWSLSVEEQFYILWPIVAVVAALIAARIARRLVDRGAARGGVPGRVAAAAARPDARVVFGILIGAVALASFAASLVTTTFDPSRAYFVTTTRAWEFAAGGLLALLATMRADPLGRIPPAIRSVLAWAGLAGIVGGALWFTDATPFPGYAALLPVVATSLVVAAGEPETRWSPRPLLAVRPVQWLGDVSYGVYLWHFPIIVLLPFVLGRGLVVADWLLVTVVTLLLAWASKELVEDPFRHGVSRSWSNGRTLAVTSAGMIGVLACSLVGFAPAEQRLDQDRQEVSEKIQQPDPCLGATSLDPATVCDPQAAETPIPDPDLADKAPESCLGPIKGRELEVCEYGADPETADRAVALVGDSHAEQWLTALEPLAERENWSHVVMAKASCPFTASERDYVSVSSEAAKRSLSDDCADWNEQVVDELEQRPEIDTVITSGKASNRMVTESDQNWRAVAAAGYVERWSELPESVRSVVAIKDTPQMSGDLIECVTENGEEAARACAVDVEDAFAEDPLEDAAAMAGARTSSVEPAPQTAATTAAGAVRPETPEVSLVDMTEYFVADHVCPPVIGGVLAFRDSHHLSWAYAEALADPLAEQVERFVPAS